MESELARPFKLKTGELIQFFSAKKDGKTVKVFPVDHSKYPSATSYLSKQKEGLGVEWDYLISSTKTEVQEWFPEFWNKTNKELNSASRD